LNRKIDIATITFNKAIIFKLVRGNNTDKPILNLIDLKRRPEIVFLRSK